MTRETKIGLLVGLGIILLIGIIVSDHLSIVQHQTPADMTDFARQSQKSVNTTASPRTSSQHRFTDRTRSTSRTTGNQRNPVRRIGPVGPLPSPSARPVRSSPTPRKLQSSPYKRPAPSVVKPRLAGDLPSSVPTLSQTGVTSVVRQSKIRSSTPPLPSRQRMIHYVKAGESLWQIAQRYYDNGENWTWIAQANPKAVGAEGRVREGVRLVIPSGPVAKVSKPTKKLADGRSDSAKPRTTVLGQFSARTYIVRSNDSLYKIAAKTLGDGDRWEDLYQANRDRLDHPDRLRVGQRLKIPAK